MQKLGLNLQKARQTPNWQVCLTNLATLQMYDLSIFLFTYMKANGGDMEKDPGNTKIQ